MLLASIGLSEPVVALLAAVFGGAGLKVIEAVLSRSERRGDAAKGMRDELRTDLATERKANDDLTQQRDEYRKESYRLRGERESLNIRLMHAEGILQSVIDECEDGLSERTLERARQFIKGNY